LAQESEWVKPERVIRGGTIAAYLLAGQDVPANFTSNRENYLNAIIDLIWYFYGEAINKGQRFDEGTFVLKDPGFRFYTFLMNYSQSVNPDIKDNPRQDQRQNSSSNPYAYPRDSSHFTALEQGRSEARAIGGGYNGLYRHYGIDVRFDLESSDNALPTGNKSHILFGKMQQDPAMIFIKMEKAGIYNAPSSKWLPEKIAKRVPSMELALHGWHWAKAQWPKLLEQQFSPEMVDAMRDWFDFDDNPNNRKERCPRKFIVQVLSAFEAGTMTPDMSVPCVLLANIVGIKFVYLLNQFIETGDQRVMQLLKEFTSSYAPSVLADPHVLDKLVEYLQQDTVVAGRLRAIIRGLLAEYDHCELRTGREILLVPEDLLAAFYYRDIYEGRDAEHEKEICSAVLELTIRMRDCLERLDKQPAAATVLVRGITFNQNILHEQIGRLAQENLLSKGFLRASEGGMSNLSNTWLLLEGALEDLMITSRKQTILPVLLQNARQPALVLGQLPYRQLLRSLSFIHDGRLEKIILNILSEKISEFLRQGIITEALLPALMRGLSEEFMAQILSQERAETLRSTMSLDEHERHQLEVRTFGHRVVVKNNYMPLTGNKEPRLLIKGLRRDGAVVWQAVLEHGESLDIGSCDQSLLEAYQNISYEPYGQMEQNKAWLGFLGLASKPTVLNLAAILSSCPRDESLILVVKIKEELPTLNLSMEQEKRQVIVPGAQIVDLFPSVKYWVAKKGWRYTFEQLQKSYPMDLARYVLGLPEEFSAADARMRYNRLVEEWNPLLYPENRQLAEAAIRYLNWALQTLTGK
jgi:hypothetical protein